MFAILLFAHQIMVLYGLLHFYYYSLKVIEWETLISFVRYHKEQSDVLSGEVWGFVCSWYLVDLMRHKPVHAGNNTSRTSRTRSWTVIGV